MSGWVQEFLPEALDDMRRLDHATVVRVQKAIDRVAENPLPQNEGGYGKPLGNKQGANLTGLLKVKLRSDGIRIVYKLERVRETMKVVIVGVRTDMEVYREALRRRQRHGL